MSRPTLGRMMSRRTCAVLCLLLIRLTAHAPAQADSRRGEAALPRYRFEVGQQLVYSYRDENLDENQLRRGGPVKKSRSECTSRWQVWVLDKNGDGCWHLLMARAVREVGLDNHVEISRHMLADFHMFPDGRVVTKRAVGNVVAEDLNPSSLLVTLPADKHALAGRWLSPANGGELAFDCAIDARAEGPGGSLRLRCRQHRPGGGFPGLTKTRVCAFDVVAGRLLGFEEESNADYGTERWHCQATVKLVSASEKSKQWLSELAREADAFFEVHAQYDEQIERCGESQSIIDCKGLLAKAHSLLTRAQASAQIEPIREQYADLLQKHGDEAAHSLRKAKDRDELCAAAPVDWELTGFDGKRHRLRDYRGRVVLLDFWYKGCGWCIKAMPQINQIAESP
jgi:hypothetical protein